MTTTSIPAGTAPERAGPLAPAQSSQLALWQALPRSVAYNVPFRVHVRPRLDAARLRRALEDLAGRHQSLRTRFEVRGSMPWQVVEREAVVELEHRSGAFSIAKFVRPFRLDELPLARACLVDRDVGSDLYVDAHHIVFDGTSIKPFVEDVLDLYAGTRPSPLRCQYLDAGRRLEERIALTRAADERYWMEVLDPPSPPLRMPLDRPRPALRRARGATTWRRLGQCGLARVRERARAEGVRLLPFLLTHYVAALAGISGQTDVVIGVPVDGRVHRDFAPLIGMFVNTVCIRATFARGDTFRSLLHHVNGRCEEAMRHRTYPFDRLVSRLRPARDFGRNPLFDAMLVLQNMDVYAFRRAGIAASVEFVLPDVSQADLSLKVFPRPEELAVALQYDSDLFAAASASFLLDRFMELLVRARDGEDYSILPATLSTTMSLDEFVI